MDRFLSLLDKIELLNSEIKMKMDAPAAINALIFLLLMVTP